MYHFDPYNVLLYITTNIPVLLMTAFVLHVQICVCVVCVCVLCLRVCVRLCACMRAGMGVCV